MPSQREAMIRRGVELTNTAMVSADQGQARAAAAEMATHYHDDAVIDYSGGLPDFFGTQGRDAMLSWMQGAREVFRGMILEPIEIVEKGDALVMSARMRGQGSASGAQVDTELAYVFWFRGDRIAASTPYRTFDEALGAADARP